MLIIRLTRTGKRNQAQYRIVVAEKTSPIKGKFLDLIGTYNPHTKAVVFNKEKLNSWIGNGSQVSNSVAKLMKIAKINHPKVSVKVSSKKLPKKKSQETEEKLSPTKPVENQEVKLDEPEKSTDDEPVTEKNSDTQILDTKQEAPDNKPQEDNKQEKGE